MKTSILGTGLTGLVGSRIVELLEKDFFFKDIRSDFGVDITDNKSVDETVSKSDASWILHMAAKTDVDGCEKDKPLGKDGQAWKINVEGTRNIVEAAKVYGKKVIYISTDFVFDGEQETYTEESEPNPINWYGVTKYKGEKLVLKNDNLVIRLSFPYKAENNKKQDFVHTIGKRLSEGKEVHAVSDLYFTPTFIDDIVGALETLVKINASGVYHVSGGDSLNPYDALETIADVFGYSKKLIRKTTSENFYAGKAKRPYKLKIKSDRINSLGVVMKTFREGLVEIKKQGFADVNKR